jgi:hypothetical protein
MAIICEDYFDDRQQREAIKCFCVSGGYCRMLCVIGGFIFLWFLGDRSKTTVDFAALAIVVGFGLVLAASGSQATGRWGL